MKIKTLAKILRYLVQQEDSSGSATTACRNDLEISERYPQLLNIAKAALWFCVALIIALSLAQLSSAADIFYQ